MTNHRHPDEHQTDDHQPLTVEDNLMARLRAADPVSPPTLPSADDPAAQRLLENAMTAPTADQPAPSPFGPPPLQSGVNEKRPPSRRFAPLLAAAAAVVVLVMGALVFLPGNSEPALAAVQNAASATANSDTGRATTTFTISASDGDVNERGGGVAVLTFAGRNLSVTVDLTELPPETLDETGGLMSGLEGRLVDDVLYVGSDGEWMAIEAPAMLTDLALEVADPRNVLLTAQELLETEEIGSTTIDGVDVTHYQSIVDLGDETVGQAGWLGGLEHQMDVDADGEVTIDLYVDGDDRMYRIDVEGQVAEAGGDESADFEISTVFTDLGADLSVEAPEGVEILDLGDFDLDEDEFDFGEATPEDD